jgi:hypothetical protein
VDQFIDVACDDCGRIVPANLAHRRNVKVKSGSTEWNSPTEINGQRGVHHNTVSHYAHHSLRLCESCELARRNADKLRFWSITVGIVLVLGFIFFNSSRQPEQSDSNPVAEVEGLATLASEAPAETVPAPADPLESSVEQAGSIPSGEVDLMLPAEGEQTVEKPIPSGSLETSSKEGAQPSKAEQGSADLDGLY